MSGLLSHLDSWKPFTVLVVGDFMLDQLVYGDAERLANDAPVPVMHVQRTEETPGGAANVCMDIAAMGGRVVALGVIGDDSAGRTLEARLHASGVDPSGLVRDAPGSGPTGRPTTVKMNLVGLAQHRHAQKMFRVDYESKAAISPGVQKQLLERYQSLLAGADVVAIEDYNKGVCTPELCAKVIELARKAGKPVLVDPAPIKDYSKYKGCTAITPNRSEGEAAAGMKAGDDPAPVAQELQRQLGCEAVVLTLDKQGAMLLEQGRPAVLLPTQARQVYDVTGAGDMVLAALIAARANGVSWPDAVRFANIAAGMEVEVFGPQPIPLEKIHRALLAQARPAHDKRRTLDEAAIEVAAARRDGKRVVFTNGVFDILHSGHIALLRKAASFGDVLVVGINSDASVKRLKGPERPVHNESDRADVLSELVSVMIVVVFEEDTPMKLLERLKPDVLVKGADYSKDKVVGGSFVESYGGRIELIPFVDGRSTTEAIRKLTKN